MLTNTKILQLEKYQVKLTGRTKKRYTIEFVSQSASNKYKKLVFGHQDKEFIQQLYEYIKQSKSTDFYELSEQQGSCVNVGSEIVDDMGNISEMKDSINLYQDIQLKFRSSTQFDNQRKFSSISQDYQQSDLQQLQQTQLNKQQNILIENLPEELQKYNLIKLIKQIYSFEDYIQDKDHQKFSVYISKMQSNVVKIQFECQYDILDLIGVFLDSRLVDGTSQHEFQNQNNKYLYKTVNKSYQYMTYFNIYKKDNVVILNYNNLDGQRNQREYNFMIKHIDNIEHKKIVTIHIDFVAKNKWLYSSYSTEIQTVLNGLQEQLKVLETVDINYQEFQDQIKEMSKYLELGQKESQRKKSSISQDILSSILVRFNNNTETIQQRVMNQMSKTQLLQNSFKNKSIESVKKQCSSNIVNNKQDHNIGLQADQQKQKVDQKVDQKDDEKMIDYVLDGFQFQNNRIIVTDVEFINILKNIVKQKTSLEQLQEYRENSGELNYLQYTALQFHSLNIDIDSHEQLVDSLLSFIIMSQQARIVKHIPRNVKNQQTLKFKHQKSKYMIQLVDDCYKVFIRNRDFYLIANLNYKISEHNNQLVLKQKGKIQLDVKGQVFKINLGPNYIVDGLYSGQIKYKIKGIVLLSYKLKEEKNLVIIDFSNSINSLKNFNIKLQSESVKILTNSFLVYQFKMDMMLNQLFNIDEIIEIAKKTKVTKFGWGVLFEKYCQESIGSGINWLEGTEIFRKYVFG